MAKNGMPSMLALLGLLAVAGYQNRDKIGAALNSLGSGSTGEGAQEGGLAGGLGGLLGGLQNAASSGGLQNILSGLGSGGSLTGGLGDLMNNFREAGHGQTADSWVTPGVPTEGLAPQQVEQAISSEDLARIEQATGLSHEELLNRLATAIPKSVDTLTPNGQMPTEEEARKTLGLAT